MFLDCGDEEITPYLQFLPQIIFVTAQVFDGHVCHVNDFADFLLQMSVSIELPGQGIQRQR